MSNFAVGYELLYADANGTKLPENEWVPATVDTIYDSELSCGCMEQAFWEFILVLQWLL